MRILFMGTPDIAAECLKALYAAGHDICAVYTRRDKPVGRKQVLTAPPVKEVALAHGTPVFQPRTLRDGSEDENIRALAPELIVVVPHHIGCLPLGNGGHMGVGIQGKSSGIVAQHTRDGLDVQSTRLPEFSCSRMVCFQRENGLRIFPVPDPNPGPIQGNRKAWFYTAGTPSHAADRSSQSKGRPFRCGSFPLYRPLHSGILKATGREFPEIRLTASRGRDRND